MPRSLGGVGRQLIRALLYNPIFVVGLLIRVALIVLIAPLPVTQWFAPFLDVSISSPSFDPWEKWLEQGGTLLAFPYGYAMWLLLVPAAMASKLVGFSMQFGYQFSLLAADVGLLLVLGLIESRRPHLLLGVYWLSPIIILPTYVLGFNDLIPAFLLSLSILFIFRGNLLWAGGVCAAAISAKLSMILALPLLLIYLYNNKAFRKYLPKFLLSCGAAALLLGMPFITSNAALEMLAGNPEMEKVYKLSFGLGEDLTIFLVPMLYIILLYMTWRLRRINSYLFFSLGTIVFLSIALLTSASPGWFIWAMPFLVIYQISTDRTTIILVGILSAIYALNTILSASVQFAHGDAFQLGSVIELHGSLSSYTPSALHTIIVAIGVVLMARIWRESVSYNDFFRLSRKPFVIGIAGDSGSGKDTFTKSITNLFGRHSVVTLSGDDYHLWERRKPIWRIMTHLNPMANDLERFCEDIMLLINGKSIQTRHYDHQTGRFGKAIRIDSNDVIIASGLHALYLPILRECYDLRIYLEMDEELRRYFKISRDVQHRGYSMMNAQNLIERREADSVRFIRKQAHHADLILSLRPIHPQTLDTNEYTDRPRLKLIIKTRRGFSEASLSRVLIGVCGLHVELDIVDGGSEVQMAIEGETTAADIMQAAEILCPRILEFMDLEPEWKDGVGGLMQLVALTHINQALTKRLI